MKPPAKVAVVLVVSKVPPPLLVTWPVKIAGFCAIVIVSPLSLVTGPFTVVKPPEKVMLPLLSNPVPPVQNIRSRYLARAAVCQRLSAVVERAAGEIDDAQIGGKALGDEQLASGIDGQEPAGRIGELAIDCVGAADRLDRAGIHDAVADDPQSLNRAGRRIGDRAADEIGVDRRQLDEATVVETRGDIGRAAADEQRVPLELTNDA